MSLRHSLAILRRWAWLLLLGAFIAGGASYMWTSSFPKVYQATTKLLVTPASNALFDDFGTLSTAERLARTYVDLIKTRAVLEQSARSLGLDLDYDTISGMVDARPVSGTGFIVVLVDSTSPQLNQDLANAVAATFISQNDAAQQARFRGPRENLGSRVDQVRQDIDQRSQELDALKATTAAPADQSGIDRLNRQISDLEQTYSLLLRDYEDVRVAEAKATDTVAVVEPATLPSAPIKPNLLLNTLLAAMLGLAVTFGLVLVNDLSDDTASTPERLAQAVRLPTLAVVGEIPGNLYLVSQGPSADIKGRRQRERSAALEAYQVLRINLACLGPPGRPPRRLLISSAEPGAGKTTTAAGLALAQARAGHPTLLVDADVRRPSLHTLFGFANEKGLTTLLAQTGELHEQVQATAVPNLWLLTAGPTSIDTPMLLGSKRMHAVLQTLSEKPDWDNIIVDGAPVLVAADALAVAPSVDAVLLVAHARDSRSRQILRAYEALERLGVIRVGLVLNRFRGKRDEYTAGYGAYSSTRPVGDGHDDEAASA